MKEVNKIIVSGVGGQGVVFITDLLVEAAMAADIQVATSEIHGLAQRGGSVIANLTFGDKTSGRVEKGGADFLLGLETLEAQRCLPFLNKKSCAVIDDNRIMPYSVISGTANYPESQKFIDYLYKNIARVVFINDMPAEINNLSRNIFVAGCASVIKGFPLKTEHLLLGLKNRISNAEIREKSEFVLRLSVEYMEKMKPIKN